MRWVLVFFVAACSGGGSHVTSTHLPPPDPSGDAGVDVAADAASAAATATDAGLANVAAADIHTTSDPRQIKGSVYIQPQDPARANGAVTSKCPRVLRRAPIHTALTTPAWRTSMATANMKSS